MRVFSIDIIGHTVEDDANMGGEVQGGGCDQHGDKKKEDQV